MALLRGLASVASDHAADQVNHSSRSDKTKSANGTEFERILREAGDRTLKPIKKADNPCPDTTFEVGDPSEDNSQLFLEVKSDISGEFPTLDTRQWVQSAKGDTTSQVSVPSIRISHKDCEVMANTLARLPVYEARKPNGPFKKALMGVHSC